MSAIYTSRTNQKLNFARLHLEQLKQAEEGAGWSKHALVESFNESVLFHLTGAYKSYLKELCELYRLDPEAVVSFDDLQIQLENQGVEAPEVKELALLRKGDSWLSQLKLAYRACWMAESREQSGARASQSEIHVVQVNPDYADEGQVIEQLAQWLNDFRSLVERQRETMKEW